MHFIIKKDVFANSLNKVIGIVPSNSSFSILQNVKIESIDETTISLSTSDMEIGINININAEVITEGAVTLPIKRLLSIIKELPIKEFGIKVNKEHIAEIIYPGSDYKVWGIPGDDFPIISELEEGEVSYLPSGILKYGIELTSYAVSNIASQQIINGVFVNIENTNVTFVGTDTRRMAKVDFDLQSESDSNLGFIMTKKSFNEARKLFDKDDSELRIKLNENQVSFYSQEEKKLIICNLIYGNYPNYKEILPNVDGQNIFLERELFLEAIQRTAILADDEAHMLTIEINNDKLKIFTDRQQFGSALEELTIDYKGPKITTSINAVFMMQPLKNLKDEEICLEFKEESPILLKNNKGFVYVLMPIKPFSNVRTPDSSAKNENTQFPNNQNDYNVESSQNNDVLVS